MLERVIGRAAVALPRTALLESVIAPLLERIGELWRDGDLRVAHEHLASAVIRNSLAQLARAGGEVVPSLRELGARLRALRFPAGGQVRSTPG
jgi:hypothetical protein